MQHLWRQRRGRRQRQPDIGRLLAGQVLALVGLCAALICLPQLLGAWLSWPAGLTWSLTAAGVLVSLILAVVAGRAIGRRLSKPLQQLKANMAQFAVDRDADLPSPPAGMPAEAQALFAEFRRTANRLRGSDAHIRTTMADSQRLRSELEKVLTQQDAVIAARTSELERQAMQLAAANTELEKIATEDGLTGLANRRAFDQFLDTAWRHSMRQGNPISVMLIDVDHFKSYNDTYGHPMGDRCLQQVATTLKTHARRSLDLVARYGGEEFVVVLPETAQSHAAQLAQRISLAVQKLQIPAESGVGGVVTISIGVAGLTPRKGIDPEVLVEQADSALYQAKRQGRNRVQAADSADGDSMAEDAA